MPLDNGESKTLINDNSVLRQTRHRCYRISHGRAPENLIIDHLKIETKLWKQTFTLGCIYEDLCQK